MKVYIVDEGIDRIGGVERIVSILSNNLNKNYDIEVISEFKNRKQPFYEYNKNIKITYIIKHINMLINKISKKGITFYFLKAVERIIKKTIMPMKIKSKIKNIKNTDIIIFARVQVALDFLRLFDKSNINPHIIVRDAATIECLNNTQKKDLVKLFPKYVDYFIVSSDESKNNYNKEFGNTKIIIEKIYNPLGITPIQKFDYSSKRIVSIGRLHSQKGFDSLINAFSLICNDNKNWILEIYGNGREEKKLKKMIVQKKLQGRVFIKPSIKDVVGLLNKSAIFVLPSRYEGYANALVEAASCGIPCITYDWISGANEIINNNINGIIVPLQDRVSYFNGYNNTIDESNMAHAIKSLIDNEKKCNKMAEQAHIILESRNQEVIISKWVNIIKRIDQKEKK